MLSMRSQTQKATHYTEFHLCDILGNRSGARKWGRVKRKAAKEHDGILGVDKNVLYLD